MARRKAEVGTVNDAAREIMVDRASDERAKAQADTLAYIIARMEAVPHVTDRSAINALAEAVADLARQIKVDIPPAVSIGPLKKDNA